MRKGRTVEAMDSEARAYGYEKETASENKGETRTKDATGMMPPEIVQKQDSTLRTEETETEAVEDIGFLASSEANELMELMEPDTSLDSISYRPDEDEDSEDVRALNANPKRIVRKAKNPVPTSMTASIRKDREEGTRPMRQWLLSGCRSCGSMIRFRSDEPHPPTCGKPQCIEKFEKRNKNKVV